MNEFIQRVSGLHEKIAREAFGESAFLKCERCGNQRSMSSRDGGRFLAHGWPKCCGYTMTLKTPRPPTASVPNENKP